MMFSSSYDFARCLFHVGGNERDKLHPPVTYIRDGVCVRGRVQSSSWVGRGGGMSGAYAL